MSKGSPFTDHRFEIDAASVFVHDDRARDGESLPGTFSDLFGGEERIEYPGPDFEGNSLPCVPDADLELLDALGERTRQHLGLAGLGEEAEDMSVVDGMCREPSDGLC
jgi:hypothetical protein